MTPARAAKRLRGLPRTLEAEVRRAEAASVRQALAVARALSGGPYSLRQLRKAGHPYSRRAPNAAYPPGVVNAGGGRGTFKRRWRMALPVAQGGRIVSRIYNTDPAGRYLYAGTARMVDRWGPMKKAILAAVAPARKRRLQSAVRRALKG